MEAEDALKDLLHEIAQQETAIAVARPSSGSIGAGGQKHAQGKEQQRQREDDVADGDGEEDENDEDFAHSEFGSRNVSPETVRLSLALQKDWWRSLPDLAYVVTKINQYGKRQTRTIRLTAEGIENVRKNGKVSSLYPYDAVVRVYMKNVKTFVVDYQSAKHSYQYRSIVAMHIVQEITSRLALRRKEDRLLTPDIATRLQEKLQKTGALLREPTPTKPMGSSGTSRRQRTTTVLPGEDRRSQQAKKLLNILGTTEQQRLESAVDWMILDEHTPEGRTLKQFCNNFAVLEKNPATLVMNLRQFMDDMRAYIIERHADELAKLTVEAASQSMLLEELSLSSVVESSLERALVARFRDRIVACLKKPNKEAEMHLKRKIAAASTKPQQFFGVAEEYVVASEWAQAIAELQALDDWDLPCKLLSAILAAAKSIYATLNYEKNRGKKGEQKKAIFLSADDFFPIFLFVVTRANLKNPLLVSEYLWGLCDPEQLNGEGGYYLTVFCSAFEYLKTLEMDTESECQQREEEAIKYLDDQILQKRKSSGTSDQPSPKAEINSSTSVDSYFSAKKDGGLTAAEDRRQRTTSSPDNGAKSRNLIRQRTESRSDCYEARRVVIGLAGCRTAQEVADEREKTREMVKEMKKEKEEPPQQQHGGSGCAWPTAAVRQRTATLRAEQTAGGGGTGGSGDEVDDDDGDDDDGEEEATGSQRARRRASKLDRARVQEAIARYDVSQKED